MFEASGYIRLLSLMGLALFITTSSGCATRALMSSDRYEKPKPESQQFRSSEDISHSWQPDSLMLGLVDLSYPPLLEAIFVPGKAERARCSHST